MNTSVPLSNSFQSRSITSSSIAPAQYGRAIELGDGFTAKTFREKDFIGAMDPLVMVDHYRMTKPTFGPHPHAGLSAVSILFEDSQGAFHNRDSLGNDFDLMPGDLYWLKAGSGVIHDELPRPNSNIHGLQVFVNLSDALRKNAPESVHVKAEAMPVYQEHGNRIRVVLGESNKLVGQQSPTGSMTILDGKIATGSHFSHLLKERENAWIYAIEGGLKLTVSGRELRLNVGQAFAISSAQYGELDTVHLSNSGADFAHFVLFSAKPIGETFVQQGPFIMKTEAGIEQAKADFAAGKFGQLN